MSAVPSLNLIEFFNHAARKTLGSIHICHKNLKILSRCTLLINQGRYCYRPDGKILLIGIS